MIKTIDDNLKKVSRALYFLEVENAETVVFDDFQVGIINKNNVQSIYYLDTPIFCSKTEEFIEWLSEIEESNKDIFLEKVKVYFEKR